MTLVRLSNCILAATMLAACASSPVTLIALPAAPAPSSLARDNAGATVLLRRVTVPGYLDGFLVVTGRNGQRLISASGAEWGERLSDAAARVLRDALSQRLGASRVLIEGEGRVPDADLSVEFLALEPNGDGRLALDARWSFVASAGERRSHAGRTQLEVPLAAQDASAVATATALALGQFADALTREAESLTPAPRPAKQEKP